ncbi:bifunctional phosphoribosylaminoimidazolecarboxamide formyltransferase/IMP cyclohydrolase, partial [archaeon]
MAHILASVQGADLDHIPIKRALLSVYDKTDLLELGNALAELGVELLSTGGSAKALREGGLMVTDISEVTGSPEILDGRVKTLHPKVHGGLLAVRGNAKHKQDLQAQGIQHIDLVVLNLYPFQNSIQSLSAFEQCVENIDIGGPCMLRAAAKNHAYVCVLSHPSQYPAFLQALRESGGQSSLAMRRACAAEAFRCSAAYEALIADYFASQVALP